MPRGAGAFDARMNAAAGGIPGTMMGGGAPIKRSAGRPPSATWALLTDTPGAHKLPSAVCKSCKQMVNYHKKREAAEVHLNQCQPFLESMMALAPEYRPEWLGVKRPKRERGDRKPSSSSSSSQSQSQPQHHGKQQQQYHGKQDPAVAEALAAAAAYAAASGMYHDATLTAFAQTKSMGAAAVPVGKPGAAFAQSDKFHELLALHFYTTGAPLTRVTDTFLAQAVALLRPDAQLPTREALGGALLDASYRSAQDKTRAYLSASGTASCIVTADAPRAAHYMAVTPRKTLFLHADALAGTHAPQTSEQLAATLSAVLTAAAGAHGLVAGAVTEPTPVHARAWQLLQRQFPSRFFHGCVSHALGLLQQDLFDSAPQSSATPTATVEEGDAFQLAALGASPFTPSLADFADDCQDVVRFFQTRAQCAAQLAARQRVTGARALVLTPLLECFTTLRESAPLLAELVHDPQFTAAASATLSARELSVRTRIAQVVRDGNAFAAQLDKAAAIARPLDAAERKFARVNTPASDVVPAFEELVAAFAALAVRAQVSASEGEYLCALARKRLAWLRRPAHDFAYVLDPRYLGDALALPQRQAVEAALVAFPIDDSGAAVAPDQCAAMATELANFTAFARADRRSESAHYTMLMQGKRSPLQFWQLEGNEWPRLQRVALKVFAMVASSAAAARTVAGFFDDERRNSEAENESKSDVSRTGAGAGSGGAQSAEAIEKRVYIRANAGESTDASSVALGAANYYWESEDVAII